MADKKQKELLNFSKLSKEQLAQVNGGMEWENARRGSRVEDRRGKSMELPNTYTPHICDGEVVLQPTWI